MKISDLSQLMEKNEDNFEDFEPNLRKLNESTLLRWIRSSPYGNRTRVSSVKGTCPNP
jgi:hypothetical protein